MGRPLRVCLPGKYYFITNRCFDGQYLMRPDDKSKALIIGILARAVCKFNVELVCFVFMSNHFHLICRFPDYNMAEFMSELTAQLCRRLNKLRGRSGPMFPRRYHDQILIGPGAIADKVAYVVNNPVKDALVAEAKDWPGVTSIHAQLNGGRITGEWYNGTLYNEMKQRGEEPDRQDAMESHTIQLTVPACIQGDNRQARNERLLAAITRHRRELWVELGGDADEPPEVMGAEAVCQTDWRYRAGAIEYRKWAKTHRLLCWSRQPGAIRTHYERRVREAGWYRYSAARRKTGEYARFPYGMYPPGEATAWTPSREAEEEQRFGEEGPPPECQPPEI
jgi:REP element-mobilizing transposase RayT